MNRAHFNNYIKSADFRILFNELGWDNVRNAQYDTSISIDKSDFDFKAIAHKSGFLVYVCEVGVIPQNALCRKIDMRLRRYSNDYILIFTQRNSEHHLWMTPVKTIEKRDLVTIEYTEAAKAEFLFSKLDSVSFEIDEQVTIVDVTARIHQAFEVNSGKITKDFYAGFKKQHNSFVSFIKGIEIEGDRQWYASVMLNRLMFCYFIQKKGFLNFDVDYLRNKLEWTKQQRGDDQFFSSFYKGFLCVLFHGGLNNPTHNREFEAIYGRIPYLNGGMFDEHQLEKQYGGIDIADEAFEELFGFFDKWRWHLDTRITATGKDINPDVLGYIFEQYINDRAQMGAYYTKEDITEYIGKNCIIPFLMDEVAKTSSAKDFKADGFIRRVLRESGDRYIYSAVGKGCDKPLPDYIEQGIGTSTPNLLERRARWNEKTYDELALPTEIWRETVERRGRYFDIKNKIASGEITQINDFITYNLDIRQFVYDLLAKTEDHLFVKHFYSALQRVTILDPTCGSGAFLFAALNILEPLYEVCIDRMAEFNGKNDKLFADELREIENKYRSNIQHFIYKSIILRNLYGVDIMVEATEIAKLRLFLKMVAVVDVDRRADNLGLDPLPDIDFNIRCGNTLVGYATKEELMNDVAFGDMFTKAEFEEKIDIEMQKVAMAYDTFKNIQLSQHDNIEEFKRAKDGLQNRLKELNELLNRKMYHSVSSCSYEEWLASHQPFHWLAEFYQIIQGNGGFDVIIGNPPYVEYGNKLKNIYTIDPKKYKTLPCSNLHAFIAERCFTLCHLNTAIGLIVPLPSINTNRMESLQKIIKSTENQSVWISAYDERPSGLFSGVDQRLIIEIIRKGDKQGFFTTGINRWLSAYRNLLFVSLYYSEQNKQSQSYSVSILKQKDKIETPILEKFYKNNPISYLLSNGNSSNRLYYRTAGGRYWKVFLDKSFETKTASEKCTSFAVLKSTQLVSILSSDIFWWYYSVHFDMFNLKDYMIFGFRFNSDNNDLILLMDKLGDDYLKSLETNAKQEIIKSKTKGQIIQKQYYVRASKPIIDEIDKVLAKHYGFTDEELDFIINYDIKYRMGSELDNDTE
ncbi:SAM-dependent methyltransferase [Alistipes indistinctus]|uniref:Eco57I restriction-modification methylase domain-containing protein n=1 Tax=Alistipes indistinctus TaxID=626932 RepID=UPI000E4A0A43|nr:DNA methyltransferase [Alistipes indistinctus]RGU38252.1 SAM-dependent methyltransferase [Alistipes indistinctus]